MAPCNELHAIALTCPYSRAHTHTHTHMPARTHTPKIPRMHAPAHGLMGTCTCRFTITHARAHVHAHTHTHCPRAMCVHAGQRLLPHGHRLPEAPGLHSPHPTGCPAHAAHALLGRCAHGTGECRARLRCSQGPPFLTPATAGFRLLGAAMASARCPAAWQGASDMGTLYEDEEDEDAGDVGVPPCHAAPCSEAWVPFCKHRAVP